MSLSLFSATNSAHYLAFTSHVALLVGARLTRLRMLRSRSWRGKCMMPQKYTSSQQLALDFRYSFLVLQSPSHYQVFNEHPAFRLASDGCLRALAMHFTMTHRWVLCEDLWKWPATFGQNDPHFLQLKRPPRPGRCALFWVRPHICHFFSTQIFSAQIFLHIGLEQKWHKLR